MAEQSAEAPEPELTKDDVLAEMRRTWKEERLTPFQRVVLSALALLIGHLVPDKKK